MYLYAPESFEWLILSTDLLDDSGVREILANPSDYIESENYFSWERFFTSILEERTRNTYLQYSKTRLNTVYLNTAYRNAILKQIHILNMHQEK